MFPLNVFYKLKVLSLGFILVKFVALVYSPDMPKSLPLVELMQGLGKNILRALRYWLHYTLVVVAWLGIVPLTACKLYFIINFQCSKFS